MVQHFHAGLLLVLGLIEQPRRVADDRVGPFLVRVPEEPSLLQRVVARGLAPATRARGGICFFYRFGLVTIVVVLRFQAFVVKFPQRRFNFPFLLLDVLLQFRYVLGTPRQPLLRSAQLVALVGVAMNRVIRVALALARAVGRQRGSLFAGLLVRFFITEPGIVHRARVD